MRWNPSLLLWLPCGSDGKESAFSAGDLGLIPGSGRSPGEGNGNPLQQSYLENLMDRGALQATVHGIAKSRTPLSDFTFTSYYTQIITPCILTLNVKSFKRITYKENIESSQ